MTIQDIVNRVNSRVRPTGEAGLLLREDINDALAIYADNEHKKDNVQTFIDNFSFLSHADKEKIISDVDSYIDV